LCLGRQDKRILVTFLDWFFEGTQEAHWREKFT
jgi:hypothetical protein